MFKIRTEPVLAGTKPYLWNIPSVYQCTWYCYYRALECGFTAPCYWDRATRTGSYTNAKEWLANFREPWEVKTADYKPVAGDIAVYDGECGHVILCETDVMTTEYRSGNPDSFNVGKIGDYKGTLLGYLHYPYEVLQPVDRDTHFDQIECYDEALRIRSKPSLDGEIVGHVSLGYYNVLQKKEADGYTWYKLATDRWCANVETKFFPKEEDIIGEIERYFNAMQDNVKHLTEDRDKYKSIVSEVHKLTDVTD